jgi:hypothetical protein
MLAFAKKPVVLSNGHYQPPDGLIISRRKNEGKDAFICTKTLSKKVKNLHEI